MIHELQALRSVRKVGPPQQPCYAMCTCRWQTEPGEYDDVRRAFFAHVDSYLVGPVAFPPRQL